MKTTYKMKTYLDIQFSKTANFIPLHAWAIAYLIFYWARWFKPNIMNISYFINHIIFILHINHHELIAKEISRSRAYL